MEETSSSEQRQPDPPIVPFGPGYEERRNRHLRCVELGISQLSPKHFRRMQDRWYQVDAFGLDRTVENRPGPWIGRNSHAKRDLHTCFVTFWGLLNSLLLLRKTFTLLLSEDFLQKIRDPCSWVLPDFLLFFGKHKK